MLTVCLSLYTLLRSHLRSQLFVNCCIKRYSLYIVIVLQLWNLCGPLNSLINSDLVHCEILEVALINIPIICPFAVITSDIVVPRAHTAAWCRLVQSSLDPHDQSQHMETFES